MMAALKSGCQSDAEFWQAVAEMQRPGAGAEPKRRGPLPLAERTPEQQAAHAAKKAARAAAKASGGGSGIEAFAEKWLSASASASDAEGAPKKRGPKPLAERTPEQQAAHAAKKAARATEKAARAAEKASEPAAAEPKPNAWLTLVADTVKQMTERGWTSWTDAKGNVWAGSVAGPDGRHVYAEGPHAGKAPSHQRGGMARASYIKSGVVGLQGEWAEME